MKHIRTVFAQTRHFFTVATACAVLVPASFAQVNRIAEDASAGARNNVAAGAATPVKAQARPAAVTASSAEVLTNVTIQPGATVQFDSQIDYSSSDTVRVTVRSANGDLPNLVLSAYWAVPDAPAFDAGDVVTGDKFFYSNTGGATLNTFGSQFRLRLTNGGSAAMTLTQVTIYARIF